MSTTSKSVRSGLRLAGRRPAGTPAATESLTLSGATPVPTAQLGKLIGIDRVGKCWVDFPGNQQGPVQARLTATAAANLAEAMPDTDLLLVLEDADRRRPIVLDVLVPNQQQPGLSAADATRPANPWLVSADGKTLRISAQQELSLRCGRASITLKPNGKIVLKGDHLLSYSRGTNRIKGGSVQIN